MSTSGTTPKNGSKRGGSEFLLIERCFGTVWRGALHDDEAKDHEENRTMSAQI